MTPAEQLEAQMRMEAMRLADKRSTPEDDATAVIKEAEKVLKFLMAGIKVAS